MKWIEEIKNYTPYNEQEKMDKDLILKAIESFDDVVRRENIIAHLTSSAFVLNEDRNKVLMIHHNIYNSWGWIGGHCDGNNNFLEVALKELREETGVQRAKFIGNGILSLDVLPVKSHMKKGSYVSSHLHLSIAYLMEASEQEELRVKEDENSGVRWINIEEMLEYTKSEPHMQEIYIKFIKKAGLEELLHKK